MAPDVMMISSPQIAGKVKLATSLTQHRCTIHEWK
jgi:hypothetical protein